MGLFDSFLWILNKNSDNFFVASFTMLGKMAAADGKISEEEVLVVKNFIGEYLVMTDQERKRALSIFFEAYKDKKDFKDVARSFYSTFKKRPVMLDLIFDMLFEVSIADGIISEEEDLLLREAAEEFKFNESKYSHFKSLHLAGGETINQNTYYDRLECSEEDSDSKIVEKYKELSSLYSKEAVLKSGIPEVFINLAAKRLEDIEEAYSMIKARRGITP